MRYNVSICGTCTKSLKCVTGHPSLAHGYLDTQLGGARDRTSNLPVTVNPLLMICYVNSLWVTPDSVCWMNQLKRSIIRFVFLCILQTWSRPISVTAPRGWWGDGLASCPPPTCRSSGQGAFHLEDRLPLCSLLEKSNVLIPLHKSLSIFFY